MGTHEFITPAEARTRLLIAYKQGGDETFPETLRRPFLNPGEQRNASGRRNLHPLAIVALVLAAVAGASLIIFSVSIHAL
jgi:hypothetical protein